MNSGPPPKPRGRRHDRRRQGRPHLKPPDWSFWLHVPRVTVYEAVALSLGIDPQSLTPVPPFGQTAPPRPEFARRLDLAFRNLHEALVVLNWRQYWRGAEPIIRLTRFVEWAASIGWGMPVELAALAVEPEPPAETAATAASEPTAPVTPGGETPANDAEAAGANATSLNQVSYADLKKAIKAHGDAVERVLLAHAKDVAFPGKDVSRSLVRRARTALFGKSRRGRPKAANKSPQ